MKLIIKHCIEIIEEMELEFKIPIRNINKLDNALVYYFSDDEDFKITNKIQKYLEDRGIYANYHLDSNDLKGFTGSFGILDADVDQNHNYWKSYLGIQKFDL